MSCEINSVRYVSPDSVAVELLLQNNDSFSYLYIDPEKIGIGLFHYFTNGLVIRDYPNYEIYEHQIGTISADPWNAWEKDWLSVIEGNDDKIITLVYDNFESVPAGEYKAMFEFPGLTVQVDKEDIMQDEGQIWLGDVKVTKEITIE